MKDVKKLEQYRAALTKPTEAICLQAAEIIMKNLDTMKSELHAGSYPDLETAHGMITEVDIENKLGALTHTQRTLVACIVRDCHERGEYFWKSFQQPVA